MGFGKVLTGIAAALVAADVVYTAVETPTNYLRPPGAYSEKDFMARCIKCGKCAEACPHIAIHMAKDLDMAQAGTPYIDAESQACKLCPDFFCAAVCPTKALEVPADRAHVDMGYAKINENKCIAFKGMRCEVCYRICPLIDEAITINFSALEDDDIHTRFLPTINKHKCVGCGLCVQRCVVHDPRSAIRIVTKAEQEQNKKK
ncbi:MAG: 4Fe-4S dicluster domain-containing protein [Eggerthellales bacterium]|nr:4Fe-4S dicluster domain-containing protein [Eggerthellales bacterium]